MLSDHFAAAAAAAGNSTALDNVARLLWRAHAEGALDDAAAEAVSDALQGRRAALAMKIAVSPFGGASGPRRPARPRSPDRQASLERRRRCALSGAVPAALASAFTMGEAAALAVVAGQVRRTGACALPIDALAALAGVSRTTVQNALRLAERLGLIERQERRRAGQRSLTNVLRIISPEWNAWLRLGGQGGGFRNASTTNIKDLKPVNIGAKASEGSASSGSAGPFVLCSANSTKRGATNADRHRKRLPWT